MKRDRIVGKRETSVKKNGNIEKIVENKDKSAEKREEKS